MTQVDRRGEQSLRYQVPDPAGGGISGAADGRHGATYHLETTVGATGPESHVIRVDRDGHRTVVSDDLWAHEKADNPGGDQTYGFTGLDDQCAAAVTAVEQSAPPGPEASSAAETAPAIATAPEIPSPVRWVTWLDSREMPDLTGAFIIHLPEAGGYQVVPLRTGDAEFEVFHSLRSAWSFEPDECALEASSGSQELLLSLLRAKGGMAALD